MFFAFIRFNNRVFAKVLDKSVSHIGKRSLTVCMNFALHLGNGMPNHIFFIIRKLQGVHHRIVALNQLNSRKARRNMNSLRMIFYQMRNCMNCAVNCSGTKIDSSRALLFLRNFPRCIDNFFNSFILTRYNWNHRNTQFFAQRLNMNGPAVCTYFIHHIETYDHGNLQFQKL